MVIITTIIIITNVVTNYTITITARDYTYYYLSTVALLSLLLIVC